ncbi:DUF1653 domain-containing protein [Patescibacteria group bacterium]|nr:DUF1653 domain-containing protein [Patescibacteria group bacterium]
MTHNGRSLRSLKTGIYRHFKGREYEVLGVAKHSETLEQMVVYRELGSRGKMWVRPPAMFTEKVTVAGKKAPRFKFLPNRNDILTFSRK